VLLNVGFEGTVLQVHDHASGEVTEVKVEEDDLGDLPMLARNVGHLYEAFADGKDFPDFEVAVKMQALIDEMERRADGKMQVQVAGYRGV